MPAITAQSALVILLSKHDNIADIVTKVREIQAKQRKAEAHNVVPALSTAFFLEQSSVKSDSSLWRLGAEFLSLSGQTHAVADCQI